MNGLQLTPRQRQVVELLRDGLTCPQIARRLSITVTTVYRHIRDVAVRLPDAGGDVPALRLVRNNARKLLEAA